MLWQGLDTRAHANHPLAHQPTLDFEDALHCVLVVEPQQMRHRPVASRRVRLDHR